MDGASHHTGPVLDTHYPDGHTMCPNSAGQWNDILPLW